MNNNGSFRFYCPSTVYKEDGNKVIVMTGSFNMTKDLSIEHRYLVKNAENFVINAAQVFVDQDEPLIVLDKKGGFALKNPSPKQKLSGEFFIVATRTAESLSK